MAALDKYIISKSDILIYRPTADLDDDRIKPYILEAQRLDLRPVLNDALYYDFVNEFDDSGDDMYANYLLLLNGTTYVYQGNTIQFDGVKPMLAYYALARFVTANQTNITRFGLTVKTTQQSTPADGMAIKTLVNELRSAAIGYQTQVIQYLTEKSSTFTLYPLGGDSTQSARKTSFNFFKA
jgi:hypothetical protein